MSKPLATSPYKMAATNLVLGSAPNSPSELTAARPKARGVYATPTWATQQELEAPSGLEPTPTTLASEAVALQAAAASPGAANALQTGLQTGLQSDSQSSALAATVPSPAANFVPTQALSAQAAAQPGASTPAGGVSWLALGGGLLAAGGLALAGGKAGGDSGNNTSNPAALNGVLQDSQGARKGALANSGLTDDNRPTLSGQGAAPGQTIKLYADALPVGETTVQSDGSWSVAPSAPLADGAHQLVAKLTDASGLAVAATAAQTVVVDTTAPSAAFAIVADAGAGAGAGPSGQPSTLPNGGHTRDTSVLISGGPSEPGSRVELLLQGQTHFATVDAQGHWAITPQALPDGSHTALVTVVDLAGNAAAAPGVTWVQDTVATAATAVVYGGTSKTPAQAASQDGALAVVGELGSSSVLSFEGAGGSLRKLVVHSGGEVPVVLTDADVARLGQGAVEVTIVTTDAAGNEATAPDGNDGDFAIVPTPVMVAGAAHAGHTEGGQQRHALHLSDLLLAQPGAEGGATACWAGCASVGVHGALGSLGNPGGYGAHDGSSWQSPLWPQVVPTLI